jgi:hypothetical protein
MKEKHSTEELLPRNEIPVVEQQTATRTLRSRLLLLVRYLMIATLIYNVLTNYVYIGFHVRHRGHTYHHRHHGRWHKYAYTDVHHMSFSNDSAVQVFEVTGPLPDLGPAVDSQMLVDQHVFANSYNHPFVTEYTPPSTSFTHVRLTLDAWTYGKQFDRLAHVILGGTEVWRTSTAEPGRKNITFGYTKDVSAYSALFKRSGQNLTVVLNNIVNNIYSGPITVSIKAEYFQVAARSPTTNTIAEAIIGNQNSADDIIALSPPDGLTWSTPSQNIHYSLPAVARNSTRVVLDVVASGNADEEFWYSHLQDPYSGYFPGTEFGKHGPNRVIEVFVDERFAGYALPFPIIYTGGYAPQLWAPIVGQKAYDVPSYQVDLTPFLPLLWEGGANISLKVSNGRKGNERYHIGEDWIVSASALIWQMAGIEGHGTIEPSNNKDNSVEVNLPRRGKSLSQILDYNTRVRTSATLSYKHTSGIEHITVSWSQKGNYANVQKVADGGNVHDVVVSTSSSDALVVNDQLTVEASKKNTAYAMVLSTKFTPDIKRLDVAIARSYGLKDNSIDIRSGQNGTASVVFTGPRQVVGFGSTESNYTQIIAGSDVVYNRHARADNDTLTFDRERTLPVRRINLEDHASMATRKTVDEWIGYLSEETELDEQVAQVVLHDDDEWALPHVRGADYFVRLRGWIN